MIHPPHALALLLLGAAAYGCSGGEATGATSVTGAAFPATPLMTLASDSGKLTIDVRGAPQPLSRGTNTVELTVRDAATSAPATGLALSVVPWMPAMAHGASVVPTATETTPGTYVITNVELFMPGTWVLKVTISGTSADHVEPSFQIP